MTETTITQKQAIQFIIPHGHTLVLEDQDTPDCQHLVIEQGLIRVALSSSLAEREDGDTITLGFLQVGDNMNTDVPRYCWLHLEALAASILVVGGDQSIRDQGISLGDWTTSLLMIQHLGNSEYRLKALLRLLVERLGRRCGAWYELPVRLTQDRIAEMVIHTRVTVTKQLSRWRREGLIDSDLTAQGGLRIAPKLIED